MNKNVFWNIFEMVWKDEFWKSSGKKLGANKITFQRE